MDPTRRHAASINVARIRRSTSTSSIRPALDHLDHGNRVPRPTAQPMQTFFGIPASEPVKQAWRKEKGLREDESLKESVTPRHLAVGNLISGPLNRECPQRTPTVKSEEHTSELQSLAYLVCRLLLEKKKKKKK